LSISVARTGFEPVSPP